MNGQLVFVQQDRLYLDTSLTQTAFAKTRMSQHLEARGYVAHREYKGWHFLPWSFTGTRLSGGERQTVLLEGHGFEGMSLKNCFEGYDKTREILAGSAVCSAMESALEQNISVPAIGAGGIFIAVDYAKIIFLPLSLFETAMACADKEAYSTYQGFYSNKMLKADAALQFTQAVIAYKLLCDTFPFMQIDNDAREEDMLDHNYVPIQQRIWALDEQLALAIDNALQRNPKPRKAHTLNEKVTNIVQADSHASTSGTARRAGMTFPLTNLYRELGLNEYGELPTNDAIAPVIRKARISQEAFEAQSKKAWQTFSRRLKQKRWFRRNRTTCTVTAGVLLALIICTIVYVHGNMAHPTSKGLSASQTVEMFYSALNNLDIMAAKASGKGKDVSAILDGISNVYVAAQSRAVYSHKEKTVTPAEWLLFNYDGSFDIYGLTQFSIGKTKKSLYFTAPTKGSHPKAVTEEGGVPLRKGTKKNIKTFYYFLYMQGDGMVHILQRQDVVTLTFDGTRWQIIALTQKNTEEEQLVSYEEFLADYTAAITQEKEKTEDDGMSMVLRVAQQLRQKYGWLSSNSEIIEARNKMQEQ